MAKGVDAQPQHEQAADAQHDVEAARRKSPDQQQRQDDDGEVGDQWRQGDAQAAGQAAVQAALHDESQKRARGQTGAESEREAEEDVGHGRRRGGEDGEEARREGDEEDFITGGGDWPSSSSPYLHPRITCTMTPSDVCVHSRSAVQTGAP